jgi:hypothetical protein
MSLSNRAHQLLMAMAVAMLSLSVSACSDETGIIIEVTAKEGFTAPVSSLRFFVGESIIRGDGNYADRNQIEDEDVGDRDLVKNPFRLLVRPPSGLNPRSRIAVGVLALDVQDGQEVVVGIGYLPTSITFVSGSVTQWRVELQQPDEADYVETFPGCFAWTDGNTNTVIGTGNDLDCDGFDKGDGPNGDCNDRNPDQFPTNAEICDNDIDDDCDPETNEDELQDAVEVCNGRDDNCDGVCDDGFDEDGDGYTVCGSLLGPDDGACLDYNPSLIDCEDGIAAVNPGASETPLADGIDNNCSGFCDDDSELDSDGDGFTEFGRLALCSPSADLGDCRPGKSEFYPGAHEFCDGENADCHEDETVETTCFTEEGGPCVQGRRSCGPQPPGDLGPCQPFAAVAPDVALPGTVCESFNGCDDAIMDQYIDPYECILADPILTPDAAVDCYTTTTSTTLAAGLCPSLNPGGVATLEFPILAGPNLTPPCTTQIIGQPLQQGFNVSLGTGAAAGNSLINLCTGVKLTVVPTLASTSASIIITRNDSLNNFQVLQVKLSNTVATECGAVEGLICPGWNTDPTPAL